jgi:uncharacterized membrane protein
MSGKTVIIQIASLVALSLISAATPPAYLPLVFILYIVVMMLITSRSVMRTAKRVDKVKSPLLFEEKSAATAMASDELLISDLKKQLKTMTLALLVPLLLVLVLVPLYGQYVNPVVASSFLNIANNEFLAKFATYFIFYAVLMLASLGVRQVLLKVSKVEKQLYVPRSYSVHKDGVVLDGRFYEYADDMCYEANPSRRFIAIYSKRLPFVIRLYTLEVSKLKSALREAKLNECR